MMIDDEFVINSKTLHKALCLISLPKYYQFVIFKPLSYCFEEAIGFDVKVSFVSRSVSRLIS